MLYIRNEVIMPNIGPHGEGHAPYLLTVFFFLLFANLLGLIPYGSTATATSPSRRRWRSCPCW